ncbi:phage tail family protein [Bacillus cereus]|nr:phage tail family protein [Bacillus cereus]MEC3256707.1 phage tail family protein [Bacillus cereus]
MVVLNAVNNLPNFDFKGKNSLDMKVYLTSKPSIPSPEMRVESVPVKGRDSSYTITDGTYEDLDIVVGVRTYRGPVGYQDTLNALNEWLRVGWDVVENEITFSEYPQWVFKVKTIKPYTWDYNSATGELTTMLTFTCDPFKYSDTYHEVVGVTSNPVPMPPREFKFGQFSTYQARTEQNIQNITDLAKFGYDRVLTEPNILGAEKDYIRDLDGQSLFSLQMKYTSGTYRNFIDDFYSSKYSTVIPTGATFKVINSLRCEFHNWSNAQQLSIKFTTADQLIANTNYYFDAMASGDTKGITLIVRNASGVEVARNTNQTTIIFKCVNTGVHTVEFLIWPTVGYTYIDSPRLHVFSNGNTQYYPARNSTGAGLIVAFNVFDLVANLEPNMLTKSMTESQMKTTLKARNIRGIFNGWCGHQTKSTFELHQYNTATNQFNKLTEKVVQGESGSQTFEHSEAIAFVDRLLYRNGNLWAIYCIFSNGNFDWDYTGPNGKWAYTNKASLSLGMDVQPASSKDIYNDGTADAFPFLKIWKQDGANTCKITFTGTNYNGTPYKEVVEVRNLNNVAAGQHIEVDCDFKDVVRYQENDSSLSVPWTSWTIAPRFPTMKVGKNNITVENASKVEIEWRTRRI